MQKLDNTENIKQPILFLLIQISMIILGMVLFLNQIAGINSATESIISQEKLFVYKVLDFASIIAYFIPWIFGIVCFVRKRYFTQYRILLKLWIIYTVIFQAYLQYYIIAIIFESEYYENIVGTVALISGIFCTVIVLGIDFYMSRSRRLGKTEQK